MGESKPSVLNKLILNNFLVKNRPLARQGKDHVIKKLIRNVKKLREKKADSDKQKEKFHRKAERLLEEVKVLKHMHPDEVMKFALLNKKSYAVVGNNPKAKIEERALCRLTEHKGISATISKLREQYTNWAEEIPVFIKGLGIRHRDKKLRKLKRLGKLESFLEKEQQYLKLLQELTDIDIDPKILKDATIATKKKEKKQTSSRSRKRKREKNMNIESLEGEGKRKKEVDQVDKVIDKGNCLGVKETKKEMVNNKYDLTKETENNKCVVGKTVEQEIRAESAMSEEDNPESDKIHTESEDSSAGDGESEHEDNETSTINDGNGYVSEDSNGSINEDENEPSGLDNMIGQDLQNHRMQVDSDSDYLCESDSEDSNECGSESDSDRNYQVATRKRKLKTKCHTHSKIQNDFGTVEVKQLDLRDIDGTIQKNKDHKVMESDDEDFFFGKTKPKKVKKSKKRSDFFLHLNEDNEDSEGSEETNDDQESDDSESNIKNSHSDAEANDNDVIDTSKYFKRNLFRSSDDRKRGEWGQGGNRGRGRDRGQGRDREQGRERGRNRGQRWDRGNRGQRGDRGYRGHRGRGDGRRGDRKREGDENEEKLFRSEDDNKDLGNQRNYRIGIDRGHKKDENREHRRGDSRGARRGSRVFKRGENQVDGYRGYTRNQFSTNFKVHHDDQRGDNRSRRRGRASRFSMQSSWQSDASNPNMIPLPERKDVHIPTVKGEAASGGHQQSLHPSWQAKLREKEKSASINQFKGKRMVFDEDS